MRSKRITARMFVVLSITLASIFVLSACASSLASGTRVTATSTATTAPTATPSGPQPTPIVATPGDTGICNVISPAEFTNIAAATATEITSGETDDTLTGLAEVYCIYDDASVPKQFVGRGTINYEFASDAQGAAAIYANVKQTFSGASDVAGIGDAAFAGTPGSQPDGSGTGLLVLRGNLLLYVSVAGDVATVTHIATSLAALALRRVA